ncbi:MAG: Spy/CpxP family protein refolding chaperone [Bacteroidales bacterium]|nr:Spy/CpxP family protein refolding chaperone [Bacteroidales bacterium]
MKKTLLSRSLLIIMMIAAMGMTTAVWAQGQGNGKGYGHGQKQGQGMKKGDPAMHMKMMIPDLTVEQAEKIKSLRLEMMKKINPLKAQIKEKRAHLNTLSIVEKPDMKAINKTIDEIGALRIEMMKIHAQMRQDVRAVLTEDQRVIFDSKAGRMMGKGMKGHGYHGSRGPGECR